MKKKILALGLAAAVGTVGMGVMAGCGKTEINVTGSSSVSPLMEKLAEAYEATNTSIDVKVTTSDSGTGIKDAQEGKNDFGMASRDLKSSETGVVSKQIATDGVAIIVNKDAALEDVTSAEVYALYASGTAIGSITSAISRESGSGTRDAFDDLIKNAEGNKLKELEKFATGIGTQSSTGAVKTQIAANASLLGYISLGSLDSTVKAVKFEGVEATAENVKNGTYKLSRPFNIVYRSESALSADAKAFIDFIMGTEGQTIVSEAGYVTVA